MTDFPKVPEGILGEETTEKTNTELFLSLVGQYFPEAIKDGEVDFTALKEEMGEFPQVSSEHYDFTWAGKQAAKKEAMSDIYGRTLKYKPQDSASPDTTENIYIEGDNLEALKLLRRNYHGKIKMIYIDPPYNTGSDFVYHDDFTMTEEELAEKSGDVVDGVRYQKNGKDTAKYHTNWLNMMYPRLKIARDLLSDDGVIFISIDDHEQENLKKICDEIFGASNFIAQVIWERAFSPVNLKKHFSESHDYIICYAKSIEMVVCNGLPRSAEANDRYNNPDNDPRGPWTSGDLSVGPRVESRVYEITVPSGRKVLPPSGYCWRLDKKTYEQYVKDNKIWFGEDGNNVPRIKRFLSEVKQGITPMTIWKFAEVGHSQGASQSLKKLFDGKAFFDYPKPVDLIKRCIQLYSDKDSIVLDFFSGSATTAHAVMQLNAEDGGHRKFILVQLPEPCDEKSEAAKAGYRTICEIGKERIRRAAKKIHEDNPDAQFDDGFKVFEVADTNIRWNTADDKELELLGERDYSNADSKDLIDFTKDYTDIDVVYEIMLRQFDIPLSTPIEKLSSVSDRTYIFADAVVVCLEPEITTELIEKLAAIEPTPAKFVLRDSAFNDDIQLKDVSFRRLSALIKNHQTEEERKSKYNNYTVEFI